jgi:hypothetical protein
VNENIARAGLQSQRIIIIIIIIIMASVSSVTMLLDMHAEWGPGSAREISVEIDNSGSSFDPENILSKG